VSDLASTVTEPVFISDPRDPYLRALYDYWNTVRGDRPRPKRADIDPTAIPKLLPHVMMYNVLPDGGGYDIRLVGEEVVALSGVTRPDNQPAPPCHPTPPRYWTRSSMRWWRNGCRSFVPAERTGSRTKIIASSRLAFCRSRATVRPSTSFSAGSGFQACEGPEA
jgi:hypothetical protein